MRNKSHRLRGAQIRGSQALLAEEMRHLDGSSLRRQFHFIGERFNTEVILVRQKTAAIPTLVLEFHYKEAVSIVLFLTSNASNHLHHLEHLGSAVCLAFALSAFPGALLLLPVDSPRPSRPPPRIPASPTPCTSHSTPESRCRPRSAGCVTNRDRRTYVAHPIHHALAIVLAAHVLVHHVRHLEHTPAGMRRCQDVLVPAL